MNDIEITACHQMTLDEYMMATEEIKKRLRNIADDYIYIGYYLRKIQESEAYRQGGYETLADFAKQEFGLSESATSRFIAINAKFSIGGYSPNLLTDFESFGSSKLSEMLTLSDEDCRLVRQGTTVATIREIKKFNKEEREIAETVEAEVVAPITSEPLNAHESAESDVQTAPVKTETDQQWSDIQKVIIEFFREQKELLNSIYELSDVESIADRINPSGNRTFKKGLHMLLMYSYAEGVALKTMLKGNTTYTWQEFVEIIVNVYADTYTKPGRVHQDFYGEEKKEPPKVAESPIKTRAEAEKPLATSQETKKTAEAQVKTRTPVDSEVEKEEQLPGQVEIEEYFDKNGDYHVPEDVQETEDESEKTEETTEQPAKEDINEQDAEEEPELLNGLFKHGDNIEFWLEGVKEASGKTFEDIREDVMYCLETRLELGYMIEMAFREE